jgi:hypothetical protein
MMFKSFVILIFLLAAKSNLLGQQSGLEDYKVYSALIQTEITDTSKSVTIIRALKKETESEWVVDIIKSQNSQDLQHLYFMTMTDTQERVSSIDSAIQKLILQYYESQSDSFILSNQFRLSVQISLVNRLTINNKIVEKSWKSFYQKNPGSGGIFAFSKIHYSQNKTTAIFYHSRSKNTLNGHGGLTVMEKINDEWKIKYHIYLWQA